MSERAEMITLIHQCWEADLQIKGKSKGKKRNHEAVKTEIVINQDVLKKAAGLLLSEIAALYPPASGGRT